MPLMFQCFNVVLVSTLNIPLIQGVVVSVLHRCPSLDKQLISQAFIMISASLCISYFTTKDKIKLNGFCISYKLFFMRYIRELALTLDM